MAAGDYLRFTESGLLHVETPSGGILYLRVVQVFEEASRPPDLGGLGSVREGHYGMHRVRWHVPLDTNPRVCVNPKKTSLKSRHLRSNVGIELA